MKTRHQKANCCLIVVRQAFLELIKKWRLTHCNPLLDCSQYNSLNLISQNILWKQPKVRFIHAQHCSPNSLTVSGSFLTQCVCQSCLLNNNDYCFCTSALSNQVFPHFSFVLDSQLLWTVGSRLLRGLLPVTQEGLQQSGTDTLNQDRLISARTAGGLTA